MSQHSYDWSCSKFASWIRGTPYPERGLTHKGWDEWRKIAKLRHPFRYWIAEELLDEIQDIVYFIPDKINSFWYYIRHMFFWKTHYIRTGLKKGVYHESEERMLYGFFGMLVDFVEIEKAWMRIAWCKEEETKSIRKQYGITWLKRRIGFRCPQAGLDYLKWESELTDGGVNQAEYAKEIIELYNWWKNIRPNRPDPYEISGWNELNTKCADIDFDNRTKEQNEEQRKVFEKVNEIEEQYWNEDTEMLIRLIKVRGGMWT